MSLVAGIDSSTQSCKVVIREADTGELVRSGRASHPDGTEVDPQAWWDALQSAIAEAGGLDDVDAVAVGGQQHGMVCLDAEGEVVRPALLWNDTRSSDAAADLVRELGDGDEDAGAKAWAEAVGSVPVASLTITKLRWLATNEPENAARTAAICLPHDWLSWKLGGTGDLADLTTDRGDASGTGYWSPASGEYRTDLLELAFGSAPALPRVVGPGEVAGRTPSGVAIGPGTGDNAAAAIGLGAAEGDVVISIGTSGVVSAISPTAAADSSGMVTGFASATGDFLPLVCTLNAARVLDAACTMLQVDHAELSELALSAPSGSDGLVLVPYLEGERTPNLPHAAGALHGMRNDNLTPAHIARAAVEGLLCGLADGIEALVDQGVTVGRILLIGGGAKSEALRKIAPAVFGQPVVVPEPGEYVADGAARQAAWVLSGAELPPDWTLAASADYDAPEQPAVRAQYAAVRDLTIR